MIISLLGIQGLSMASEVTSKSTDVGIWIKIYLKFHRPKYECERGFGFCFDVTAGIEKGINPDEKVCPVKAKLDQMNQLVFEISEYELIKYEKQRPYLTLKKKVQLHWKKHILYHQRHVGI
jgi:hypothetical protein